MIIDGNYNYFGIYHDDDQQTSNSQFNNKWNDISFSDVL